MFGCRPRDGFRPRTLPGVVSIAILLIGFGAHASAAIRDVTAYGAIANDGLNDLNAINIAISASSPGDTVLLPAGAFSIAGSIATKSGVTIAGVGRDSTTIQYIGGGGGSMIDLNGRSNVEIANLTLNGNGSALYGIDGSNGSGHYIHENAIQNLTANSNGIRFSGAGGTYDSGVTDSRIVNNQLSNIGVGSEFGSAIRMAWGSSRNQVIGNTIANAGRGGVFGNDGSTDLVIKNNTVTGSGSGGTGLGIEVWNGCDRALIENNTVDQWLSVDRSSQVAVRNNRVNGGYIGLELAGGHDNVFTNNTVNGAAIGISVSDPNTPKERVLWAHNTIRGSGSWGAQIYSEQSAGAVRQMYFYKNTFQGSAQAGFRFHPNYPVGSIQNVTLDANTIAANSYGLTAGDWSPNPSLDKLTVVENVIAGNSLAAFSGSMGTPAGDSYFGTDLRWTGNTVTGNGANNAQTSRGTFFNNPPSVSIVGPATIAPGKSAAFSLNYAGPNSLGNVLWDFGDGLPETSANSAHVYSLPGTYRIGTVVWDSLGRSAHDEHVLTVVAPFALTRFDEPQIGAVDYAPAAGAAELGFTTTQSPTSGVNPLVGVAVAGTERVLSHQSVNAATTLAAVDLRRWSGVGVSLDLQVSNTGFEVGDFVRVYATNGREEIDLFNQIGTATTDGLDNLAGRGFTTFSAAIPNSWTQATLVATSSSNSSTGAERYDFDNLFFTGIRRRQMTQFNEPPVNAASFSPGLDGQELGFATTQSPTSGVNPLVGVQSLGANRAFTHRSVIAVTTLDPVELLGLEEVEVSVDLQVANTTYEAGDFVRIYATNGSQSIDLFNQIGAATTDGLDNLAGRGFTAFRAALPGDWTQAWLVISSSSNSSAGAERYDFDNILFTSAPTTIVGDANGDGAVDRADLAIVVAHLGMATGATFSEGDFNADGRVSLADVTVLQRNFGSTPMAGASLALAIVPEPGTLTLALGTMMCAFISGARHRRRGGTQHRRLAGRFLAA